MKVTRSKIDPRKKDKVFTTEGILGYDVDNLYPQRVTNIYNCSGVAVTCIDVRSSFTEGGGFKDQTFYKLVINSDGLTNDKLLRFLAGEITRRNGFAIHVNYDANGKIVELRPIPFADCRLPDPKKPDHKNQIAICDKWENRTRPDEITWIDRFNPSQVTVQVSAIATKNKISLEEAWKQYKGQIYWHSYEGADKYPLCPFDAVLEDMETDGSIKKHKRKKARSGFNLDFFLIHKGKFESEEELQVFKDGVEVFQGEEGSTVCVVDLEQDEEKPELLPVPQRDAKGDFYIVTEEKVQDNIRIAFGIPGVLIGESIEGAMGLNSAMSESYAVMNALTDKHRRLIEETMQIIFSHWVTTASPTGDYSIIKSSYDTGESSKPLAVQFGVGGTQSLQSILADPLLSDPRKINVLRITFGFTKQEAEAMVLGTDLPEEEAA